MKTSQPKNPKSRAARPVSPSPSRTPASERRAILAPLQAAVEDTQALVQRVSPGVRAAVGVLAASLAAVQAGDGVPPATLKLQLRQVAAEIAASGAGADPQARAVVNRLMAAVTSVGPCLAGLAAPAEATRRPAHVGGEARAVSRRHAPVSDPRSPKRHVAVRPAKYKALGQLVFSVVVGLAVGAAMLRAGAPAGHVGLTAVGSWAMVVGWLRARR